MSKFSQGDAVRVDIPDETDPDHEDFHGKHGSVVCVLEDNAGKTTGREQDSQLYRVELESGEVFDF